MGVPLFFMISGFVILWTATAKTPFSFVASRVSRLYPSFWVCVSLTAIVLWLVGEPVPWRTYLANLTMVPRQFGFPYVDGVYWTLWTELRFYALIFFLLLLRRLHRIEWVLPAWLVICAAGWKYEWLAPITLADDAALFCSGCYFYLIRTHGPSLGRWIGLAASTAMSVVAALDRTVGMTKIDTLGAFVTVGVLVLLCHAVFLLVALRKWNLSPNPLWYWLGCLTYPLYLIHNIVGKRIDSVLLGLGWNEWAAVLTVIVFVTGVAILLAALVERKLCAAFNRRILEVAARLFPRLSVQT
jgi:peptidoglycan/LPS O-acetylase OafA/YrhL